MKGTAPKDIWIVQSYLQIILARCVPLLTQTEKSQVGSKDLIYQTVSYISANFRKSFLLEDMAKDLGVSKYVLSRVFSKTFHRVFKEKYMVSPSEYRRKLYEDLEKVIL